MFFDIAWPEFMLIAAVALVVIGPKDLPRAMRVAGVWLRKARTLSREFQNSIDQMIREAELEEVREDLRKATEIDLEKEIRSTVDPTGELAESIKPPELPDYFDEAPALAAPAVAEPTAEAVAEPEPAAEFAAEVPEPSPLPAAEPGVEKTEPSEPAIGAAAPDHEPTPSKP